MPIIEQRLDQYFQSQQPITNDYIDEADDLLNRIAAIWDRVKVFPFVENTFTGDTDSEYVELGADECSTSATEPSRKRGRDQ